MIRILRSPIALVLASAILLTLTACSGGEVKERQQISAEEMFSKARGALRSARWEDAQQIYQQLITRFPFGNHAQHAQLELAYSFFKNRQYDRALAACDKFIRTYPRHENLAYAYYLKGVVNQNRTGGTLGKLLGAEPASRNTQYFHQAFSDFKEVVRLFPQTPYANDARQRMVWLRNTLAEHELSVAKYYLRRDVHIGALRRAQHIIENYERTPAMREALLVSIRAYEVMGMEDLAADTRKVYEHNYPGQNMKISGLDQDGFLAGLWPF